MHCRAIEEMLKEVERETWDQCIPKIIRHFQADAGMTFEQICDTMEIPQEERHRYFEIVHGKGSTALYDT